MNELYTVRNKSIIDTAALATFVYKSPLDFRKLASPFGLRHKPYTATLASFAPESPQDFPALARPNAATQQGYKYQYNDYGGKSFEKALDEHTAQSAEWNNALGYNMNEMEMRHYDPAIARWVAQDPVTHHSMSPYNAFDNNPIFWADPSGADGDNRSGDWGLLSGFTPWGIMFQSIGGTDTQVQEPDPMKKSALRKAIDEALSGTALGDCKGKECRAHDGPFSGNKLEEGLSYQGSVIVPWCTNETRIKKLNNLEFTSTIQSLSKNFKDLKADLNVFLNGTAYAGGGNFLKEILTGTWQSASKRTLLLSGLYLYLNNEKSNLDSTNQLLLSTTLAYIAEESKRAFEITVRHSGYAGLDDYTSKYYYSTNGVFLGGYKSTIFNTIIINSKHVKDD